MEWRERVQWSERGEWSEMVCMEKSGVSGFNRVMGERSEGGDWSEMR